MRTQSFLWILLACCSPSWANLTPKEIFSWSQPRGAVIRSDILLQGGVLQVLSNGSDLQGQPGTYTGSSLLNLSLTRSFDIHDESKPAQFDDVAGGQIPTENIAYDGFMFADYDEIYTYGGTFPSTDSISSVVISDPLYDPDRGRESNIGIPTTYSPKLPDNTDFVFKITAGAGANAPSESLGFYLGGYKTASNRAVTIVDGPDELEQSSSLIIVNTTSQSDSIWTIPALPNGIRSRTRAMINWIPVGSQGMLVVVGGALNPIDLMNSFQPWDNNTMEQVNNFTQEILLYDIASTRWFVQDIKEGSSFPTRLTQACCVVATRFDDTYTHHEIYMYGGWDGSDGTTITGKVEVLSIPSFQYISLPADTTALRRLGHLCFSPYPDQMIVVGGTEFASAPLNGTGINLAVDAFNLTSLQWTGKYDPNVYANYTPSTTVSDAIGNDYRNGMDPDLLAILNSPYRQSKLKYFGPFQAATTSESTPTPTPPIGEDGAHNDKNKWVVPVAATLGTVGGLALLFLILFCFIIRPYRRRRARDAKRHSNVTSDTAQQRSFFQRWLDGTTAASTAGKDLNSETDGAASPPPQAMSETGGTRQTPELEGYGGIVRNSRWSGSTAVRPPLYGGSGPHEIDATDSGIHEVHGRSSIGNNWAGQSPNIKDYPLYPPSVVSGGHARSEASEPISQPSDSARAAAAAAAVGAGGVAAVSEGSSSPRQASTAPPSPQRKPVPIGSISETAVFGHGGGSGGKEGAAVAVSPLASPQRPTHRRHNSSMSSGLSPLPSPGEKPEEDGEEDEKRGATI